ncbi:MAG TPA: hypothetical protein VFM45_07230 [Anaeromyxobacteraceae bacterium]|nr:hypothetical protein [Anaeromyxobacteraceae bacterium]
MRDEGVIGPAVPSAAGIDGELAARPGVPREWEDGWDPGARWPAPARQAGVDSIGRSGPDIPTPVFGTAQPARGVPGALRRAAYRIPEHRASRWLLLLAADRLDAAGRRARAAGWLVPAVAALAAGYLLASRALARGR